MSSIGGLNNLSFRALSQDFTRNLQTRANQRGNTAQNANAAEAAPRPNAPTQPNERNLARATRDLDITMRAVGRESKHAIDSLGNNTAATDQIGLVVSEFEKSMQGRFDAFVEGGAQDYLSFAEQTAVARRDFRTQVRDIASGAQPPAPQTDPSAPTATTNERHHGGRSHAGNVEGVQGRGHSAPTTPNMNRAQRDMDSLERGLDREFDRLNTTFGGNTEAMDKFTSLRKGFMDSAQAEFDALAQGSTTSYLGFAERVAVLRQGLNRDLRSAAESFAPTTTPTTTPSPTTTTSGPDEKAVVNTDAPTSTTRPSTVTPNERNIGRAKRDADILLRGLGTETDRLVSAMGDTPESREIRAQADGFRSMLEERLAKFVEDGGSDYLGFAEEMASARRSLSGNFHTLAGPKLDRLG